MIYAMVQDGDGTVRRLKSRNPQHIDSAIFALIYDRVQPRDVRKVRVYDHAVADATFIADDQPGMERDSIVVKRFNELTGY